MSRTRTIDRIVEGTRIGDYVIEHELRSDEIGAVYLGKHVVLPRRAELKVMHSFESWQRAKAVQMLREACVLEALSHPGIPRVYECGVLPDKRTWSAFEHVEEEPVAVALAKGALPVVEALALVSDVADILDHIHRRGIVHRKVSAEVIVRSAKRRCPVYLRQWSDACTFDAEGHIALDPRDDVHELGVVAYRALTGQWPDLGGTARDRYPEAPPDVARLIDRMLAIEPADRPSSAEVRERARNLGGVLARGPRTDAGLRAAHHEASSPTATNADDPAAGFAIRISGGRPRSR